MLSIIAQALPNALLDPSWASLIIQGGAFLLLSYVVVFMAPNFMREGREERAMLLDRFEKSLANIQTEFDKRNTAMLAAIRDAWVEEIRRELPSLCKFKG